MIPKKKKSKTPARAPFVGYPRSDEGVTTTAPYRRRVGQECELAGDSGRFSIYAWENGLGTPPRGDSIPAPRNWGSYGGAFLHPAHCTCDVAYNFPIHTTTETAGGEHVIGGPTGVLFASPAYMEAIAAVAECAEATGHSGEGPGHGGHTHVQTKDLSMASMIVFVRNVMTLWPRVQEVSTGAYDATRSRGYTSPGFQFTLPTDVTPPREIVANGDEMVRACGDNYCRTCGLISRQELHDSRTYRPRPNNVTEDVWYEGDVLSINARGGTFRLAHSSPEHRNGYTRATTEWRVWNTQTSRWRLFLAAGVSSAMVEAAHQGRAIERIEEGQPLPTLEEFLDGLLGDDLMALMDRQRAILKGDTSWAA